MKTSKPFSTISYNTKDFLIAQLNSLYNRRLLDFWAIIYHYAEEDESKDHWHVYFYPNGSMDTDPLKEYFMETDPTNIKPLGIKMIKHSYHFADWYLYAIHDKDFLLSKGESRKHHYSIDDVISSDKDDLLEMVHTIDFTKYTKQKKLLEKINTQADLIKLARNGEVPLNQVGQINQLINWGLNDYTYRNGRTTHTPKVDDDTGELIEIPFNILGTPPFDN